MTGEEESETSRQGSTEKRPITAKEQKRWAVESMSYPDRLYARIPVLRSILDLKEKPLNLEQRTLYSNMPIQEKDLDTATGHVKARYATNKTRTTKYTPSNFIPKNIFLQFQNVANIYFLVIAILSAFKIFGVANSGLAAMPIICIVVVTAIRDAIEDSRRQMLDSELNKSITVALVNVENLNVVEVKVSYWRRFKKLVSRFLRFSGRVMHLRGKPSEVPADLHSIRSIKKSYDYRDPTATSLDLRRSQDQIRSKDLNHGITGHHFDDKRPKFTQIYWKEVKVGQFVKIFADNAVPADLVVLSTSDPDNNCFIETRNLDGETNLKPRSGTPLTSHLKRARDCAKAEFMMELEPATSNLSSFGYKISTPTDSAPLSSLNFLPRGSTLRNTEWIIGYVVYTGDESKIVLNAGETPTKRSRLSKDLNFYMMISFVLLFILSFVGGLVQGLRFRSQKTGLLDFDYRLVVDGVPVNAIVNFFATLILLQNLIPISIYISIEIVRTIQAFFMYSDLEMYDEVQDYPCTPKTWSISDDLGQIEFVFSDKTGTLTQNSMVFRKCAVRGKSYGVAFTEATAGLVMRTGGNVDRQRELHERERMKDCEEMLALIKESDAPFFDENIIEFVSSSFMRDLNGALGPEHQKTMELFGLALATCNTVAATVDHDLGKLYLRSESPDESALVETARDIGFVLVETDKNTRTVLHKGTMRTYDVLATIPFSSDRKRMTVLLRSEGSTIVFCKGADSVISKRLHINTQDINRTSVLLDGYASEGLRTLLIGYKEVSNDFAEKWCKRWSEANTLQDRLGATEIIAEELESDLLLVGCTAIEDKLQVGVPHTIHLLLHAGIKVWALTGDKVETAVSIGYACNLIETDMKVLYLRTAEDLETHLKTFNTQVTDEEIKAAAANHLPASGNTSLVVDGDVLAEIVQDEYLSKAFALIGKKCKSVLCCRVSPSQKAKVVDIIKRTFDVTTLAIGDGANDVSMIQKADVGVGIVGVEGRQAAMSSDYAVGQFRFLERLILVHGRWCYMRIAELVANLLYKNFVFTMCLFWYGIFNDFDNSYLFDYTYVTLFNSIFTSLPVIFMGIFDKDISDKACLKVPGLYSKGILRQAWTKSKFWIYVTDGTYQSAVAFFFAYCLFYSGRFVNVSGRPADFRPAIGAFVGTVACVACNLYVLMNTHRWDWLISLIVFLSCVSVFAWTAIFTAFVTSRDFYWAAHAVYATLSFWAYFLLALFVCLLPRFVYLCIQRCWYPADADVVAEQDIMGMFDGDSDSLESTHIFEDSQFTESSHEPEK